MDLNHRLEISFYKTIAAINEEHNVYLVQHQATGKICIKKVMDIYNPKVYMQLYENHITGTPRILALYEENQQLTVIEEYISGTTLEDKIAASNINSDDISSYMLDLCNIIQKLHDMEPAILHRDIKPSNIIITEYNHAVLLDFNAAKYYSETSDKDTVLLGTTGYAAPEQYGFGSSSPQTDIYALGIILKEMTDTAKITFPLFDKIFTRCTMINKEQRYQTVAELIADFTSSSKPKTLFDFLRKFTLPGYRSKTPWKIFTASLFYLLIIASCIFMPNTAASSESSLILAKSFVFLSSLATIFSFFNYLNIQRFCPLCKSKHLIIRFLGILIVNISLILLILFMLFIAYMPFLPARA